MLPTPDKGSLLFPQNTDKDKRMYTSQRTTNPKTDNLLPELEGNYIQMDLAQE